LLRGLQQGAEQGCLLLRLMRPMQHAEARAEARAAQRRRGDTARRALPEGPGWRGALHFRDVRARDMLTRQAYAETVEADSRDLLRDPGTRGRSTHMADPVE